MACNHRTGSCQRIRTIHVPMSPSQQSTHAFRGLSSMAGIWLIENAISFVMRFWNLIVMPSQCSAATGPAPIVKILIRLDLAVALALWKLRDFQKWDVTLRLSSKYPRQSFSHFSRRETSSQQGFSYKNKRCLRVVPHVRVLRFVATQLICTDTCTDLLESQVLSSVTLSQRPLSQSLAFGLLAVWRVCSRLSAAVLFPFCLFWHN